MFFPVTLLSETDEPFDSPEFIFEPKFNGIRLLLSAMGDQSILYTRHQKVVTEKIPEIYTNLVDTVLDGEIIVADPEHGDNFEQVRARSLMTNELKIKRAMEYAPATYVVFDVLFLHGNDLRKKATIERKKILDDLKLDNPNMVKNMYVDTYGTNLFETIKEKGMEGIVAKRKTSIYSGKRSPDWIKIINWTYAPGEIIGYRKDKFGIFCKCNEVLLVVELVNSTIRREIFSRTRQLKEDKKYVYFEPIPCELKGRGFNEHGTLRTPLITKLLE